MIERPLILVSNDDGVQAEGLVVLAQALCQVGDVVVVAPEHNWSAVGHTKTMHKPLRATEIPFPGGQTTANQRSIPRQAPAGPGGLDRQGSPPC